MGLEIFQGSMIVIWFNEVSCSICIDCRDGLMKFHVPYIVGNGHLIGLRPRPRFQDDTLKGGRLAGSCGYKEEIILCTRVM